MKWHLQIVTKKLMQYMQVFAVLLFSCLQSTAQEFPPSPIHAYVNTAQGLNFGAFYPHNAGGSVIIYPNGSRSVTGDIVEVNAGYSFSPAEYEIEANPGTIISILGGTAILTGSNGGSVTLYIGDSNPLSPFVTTAIPPARTIVNLGGTLSIDNILANPAGAYSGIFEITFIQE